ncbi:MAG: hypothetical protein ACJAZO_001593 [Myxococcota bacterium]|jgi:hypothetical protein
MSIEELAVAWSCLHDGTIEAIQTAGTTRFTISCQYITEMFGKPDGRLVIEVSGPVTWNPWDDAGGITELGELVDHEPEIMNAEVSEECVAVNLLLRKTSGGVLTLPGKDCRIRWADGDDVTFSGLRKAISEYWKGWEDKKRSE